MGEIAFVFAGQGSQYTGMGSTLSEVSPKAREVFETADKLRPGTSQQCFAAPMEELSITKNTQPSLFCVDLAAAKALEEAGITPHCVAGFSLGEIPAAAFSGMLSTEAAFSLVTKRGLLMQEAAEKTAGAMAAVLKLSNEEVEALCQKYTRVYPVNYNCPGQLVVAGDKAELEAFSQDVAEKKGRAKILNVSGGFHSPFMETAALGLREELKNYTLRQPTLPVYSNVTAMPYGENRAALLEQQVVSPVRWQQTIENMIAAGVDTFIEVGAGKTLSGLIKKINKEVRVFNVEDAESLNITIEELKSRKA